MKLPIIQSLWIGDALSVIEQLCIASFLKNGHEFHLYAYDEIKNIPTGTIVKDANEIIDKSKIFTYNNGRVSGFANWFRLELLYQFGGFWVDMDVICIKPFDFKKNDLIFGMEDNKYMCNAVLGFPKNHDFIKYMIDVNNNPNKILPYDRTRDIKKKIKRKLKGQGIESTGWGEISGPIGFTKALKHFDYLKYAQQIDTFFPVHYANWKFIYSTSIDVKDCAFKNTYAIHLWNELARREKNFDKNATFPDYTLIEKLKRDYL